MTLTVDDSLGQLLAPRPHYRDMAAHAAFVWNRFRVWNEAVEAAAKTPSLKTAAKLASLLGDVPSPPLRHHLAEAHEEIDAGEIGLQHALEAAACSPCWDPVFVAWSIRGIAFWLHRLGRTAEAKAVIQRLWSASPFYPVGLKEAAAIGVEPPPPAPPTGSADSLRLAGFQVLLEGLRPTHLRHIAMASSLLWTGEFAAAARMARLAGKGTKYEGTWAADIAAFAEKQAARTAVAATPLPDKAWGARGVAVREAVARGDLGLLRALALDPQKGVMLDAWVGLAKLGEGTVVRGLLEEMIAASKVGRGKTELCFDLEAALAKMPHAARTKAIGGAATPAQAPDAVALAKSSLAAVKKGAECALPLEPTKSRLKPMPPSLAAWLDAGGGLHVTKPSTVGALAKAAHGAAFAKLPAALAKSKALALDLPEVGNDTLEVLALEHADARAEAPVLALDVSDGPRVFVSAESFGAWIAADVGVGAPDATAVEAAEKRIFGRRRPSL